MNEFQATAVMIGLFAVRCVLPIALTLGIGYAMNRWVSRAEAQEAAAKEPPAPVGIPIMAMEERLPCWVLRNCDEATRSHCPAGKGVVACWVARLRVEGTLPAGCADCPLYEVPPARLAMGD